MIMGPHHEVTEIIVDMEGTAIFTFEAVENLYFKA